MYIFQSIFQCKKDLTRIFILYRTTFPGHKKFTLFLNLIYIFNRFFASFLKKFQNSIMPSKKFASSGSYFALQQMNYVLSELSQKFLSISLFIQICPPHCECDSAHVMRRFSSSFSFCPSLSLSMKNSFSFLLFIICLQLPF